MYRVEKTVRTALLIILALTVVNSVSAAEALFVGAGDIAKCGSRLDDAKATAKVIDDIFRPHYGKPPEGVVFTLGDNVYPRGRAKELANCYDPAWGRHKFRTRPSIGNHDYATRRGKAYFEYFGDVAGDRDKGYYSYDLGDWHIIALNTNCGKIGGCGPGSRVHEWLADDLKNNPNHCTLAYGHHPMFSSGKHGDEDDTRPLFELLYDNDADLLLGGHDHNYERFAPHDPQGRRNDEQGIRQFVVGTGGREHRNVGRPVTNSEVIDNTSYGVLKLALRDGTYDWQFVPIEGHSFTDSDSGECH